MTCEICGSEHARTRKIPRSYGRGAELIVIEDVPVVSCIDCGESYMTAETAQHIDDLRRNEGGIAEQRTVPVASYA
ncbi:MAG: YgiT-type zinc finger domain-containing protein [Rhodothermales bacterium]|jgi:YgiT-type zinc finger domain-containing protein